MLDKLSDAAAAFTPDQALALCALAVSIVSILLGVFSLRTQRRHNELSVRPLCGIFFKDFLDEISIYVTNNGIGPMIVNDIEFESEGERFRSLHHILREVPATDHLPRFVVVKQQRVLHANGSIQLFRLLRQEGKDGFDSVRDAVRSQLAKVTIYVSFQDIYGNRHKPQSRKLLAFARPRQRILSPAQVRYR